MSGSIDACDRQVRAVYNFAIATFERCGGRDNPACMQLARGSLKAVLEACRSYEAARAAARSAMPKALSHPEIYTQE